MCLLKQSIIKEKALCILKYDVLSINIFYNKNKFGPVFWFFLFVYLLHLTIHWNNCNIVLFHLVNFEKQTKKTQVTYPVPNQWELAVLICLHSLSNDKNKEHFYFHEVKLYLFTSAIFHLNRLYMDNYYWVWYQKCTYNNL